ncbi:hypothetical protein C7S16_5912 [Burkholderia thailandensis]|uniref:Uncharacterized protein n=1 Tax=Burkholderia thailandensis TaxID=57975 RepID=A0AAW9CR15_BURTH|nr:hypothetical protein [Burkholderia thailandensis]MDW9253465.1 hypothetical protein [Burkholderia thailandensis]
MAPRIPFTVTTGHLHERIDRIMRSSVADSAAYDATTRLRPSFFAR